MFCTYVCYIQTDEWMDSRTASPEIMNHFSSLCFGLCLGVDQQEMIKNWAQANFLNLDIELFSQLCTCVLVQGHIFK